MQSCVGLDDVLHEATDLARSRQEGSAHATNDAGRHRSAEAERIADSDYQLADAQFRRVSEHRGSQSPTRRGPNHGEVGQRVGTDDLEIELAPIGERSHAPIRSRHDMRRSEEETVGRDEDGTPATFALAATGSLPHLEVRDRSGHGFGNRSHYLGVGVESLCLGSTIDTGPGRTGRRNTIEETQIDHLAP
jgi:hypothetical protein